MQILKGHISEATAFVVDDYPYSFRLRCKIRYWIEYRPSKGFRFMSQTTNPKRGDVWNKAKAGTYSKFGMCLYLDEKGHVQHKGLSEYSGGAEARAFSDTFREGVPEAGQLDLDRWVAAKTTYDEVRQAKAAVDGVEAHTLPLSVGTSEARAASAAVGRRVVRVCDWNPAHIKVPGEIARHDNVPRDWTTQDIITRFGISSEYDVFDGDETKQGRQIQQAEWRLAS